METHLTIKHIAPYLPYGLMVLVGSKTMAQLTASGQSNETVQLSIVLLVEAYKPLLRPLSDLTKEIEHSNEKFVPSTRLDYGCIDYGIKGKLDKDYAYTIVNDETGEAIDIIQLDDPGLSSYRLIQQLLEWHFDVFGLLDAGLALPKTNN